MYRYIYGPVPSRRLGISLGVDLTPHKVCSFNCVYCECGRNTRLTPERKEYNPLSEILAETRDYLAKNPAPDFITLSGSGEPTLHTGIGEFIRTLKAEYPQVWIAVLTNSSLLPLPEVRHDLMEADIVLPSLDGVTDKAYMTIDRPHPSLKLPDIIDGIIAFTHEFKAQSPRKEVWLEVFIVEGVNTDAENIRKLKEVSLKINPDRIQLNTLDRPGTESWVAPASKATMTRIMSELDLPNVEIVSRYKHREEIQSYRRDIESTILETLTRRPSTVEDLALVLGVEKREVFQYLDILESEGRIKAIIGEDAHQRGVFYRANPPKEGGIQ